MSKKYKIITVSLLAATLIAVGFYVFGNQRPANEYNQDEKAQIQAAAETIIASKLKSPGSAQFSNVTIKNPVLGDSRSIVFGDVDSQNSFGALLRTHFFLQFDYEGGDKDDAENWKIQDLVLDDYLYTSNGEVVTSTFSGKPEPRSMGKELSATYARFENAIKLTNLRDEGLITEQEFETKKQQLLGN